MLGEFALEGVDQRVEIYTLKTGAEELDETQIIEPEDAAQEETVLPPDALESDEPEPSVPSATAEDVLGVESPEPVKATDEEEDGTESSVHIAAPVSSTGRSSNRRKRPSRPRAWIAGR